MSSTISSPISSPNPTDRLLASPKVDAKTKAVMLFSSDMLSQMEEDFQKSGDSIMHRMREMGSKMDDLERSISGMMHDAGLDDDENGSKGSADHPSSSPQRPPSNSSPSQKTNEARL